VSSKPFCASEFFLGSLSVKALLPLLAFATLAACGGSTDGEHARAFVADQQTSAAEPIASTPAAPSNDVATGACTSGDARECKVMLGLHGDVVNCFVGIQFCDGGNWGPCHDPNSP
jgi:hypothetical protein